MSIFGWSYPPGCSGPPDDNYDDAKCIWNETHGCRTCAKHWIAEGALYEDFGPTLEVGDCPVWSDCPDCHGDGEVFQ
jgi:hypothetical protein